MSTKNKIVIKTVKDLTADEKLKILQLIAAGYPLKEVARDFQIRYASIRHVIFTTWEQVYPEHFKKFGRPLSIANLRNNQPTHDIKPEPKARKPRAAKVA